MTGQGCLITGGIQKASMEVDHQTVAKESNPNGKLRSRIPIVEHANQSLKSPAIGIVSSTEPICILSLKGKGREKLIDSHHERQKKRRNATNAKNERRSSVLKSLAILDIEDGDVDYQAPHNSHYSPNALDNDDNDSSSQSQRTRYMRRGSVTRHKIEADLIGMQPSEKTSGGDDESDYGSTYSSEYEGGKERKRYLRRGSVTKYSLDYASLGADMQPEKVASSNSKMFKKGGVIVGKERLPPPPSNDSFRLDDGEDLRSFSGKARSCHVGRPPHNGSTKRRSKDGRPSRRGSMKIPTNDNPRPGDDYWSGNMNDSGHHRRDMFFDSPEEIISRNSPLPQCMENKSVGIASSVHSAASAPTPSSEFHPITPKKPRSGRRICVDEAELFTVKEKTSCKDHRETIIPTIVKAGSTQNQQLDRRDSGSSFDSDDSSVASFGGDSFDDFASKGPAAPIPRNPRLPIAYSSISKPASSLDKIAKKKSPPEGRFRNLFSEKLSGSTLSSSEGSPQSSHSIENGLAPGSGEGNVSVLGKVCEVSCGQVVYGKENSCDSKRQATAKVTLKDTTEDCTKTDLKPRAICRRKKVRFGRIVITEFPIILGDNPAVTSGAPITIDWIPQGERFFSVESYEQCKPARRRRRRLLISVSHRAILLLAAGYSIDDIADASINAQQIKFSRQETMQASQYRERVSLLMENTNDAFSGMVQNTGKKLRALITKPVQHSETARTA
jgi:hypothetical protein